MPPDGEMLMLLVAMAITVLAVAFLTGPISRIWRR
jgi:hypothetical protein